MKGKEPEKRPNQFEDELDDGFIIMDKVASSTDCTGLIPTPPANDEEQEAYSDIYAVPKQQGKHLKSRRAKKSAENT